MMLRIGPEFDKTVCASANDIFVKSTPSTSNTLSCGCNRPYAGDCCATSFMNIPWKILNTCFYTEWNIQHISAI